MIPATQTSPFQKANNSTLQEKVFGYKYAHIRRFEGK